MILKTPMIPYGKQDISQADIDAVVGVLQSDYLTQGEQVPLFEQTVATYCGAQYAVAVNSATSALHIACLALELGGGIFFGHRLIRLLLLPTVRYFVVQRLIL